MKTKDPAFLFYSQDWITGTTELSPAEKGIYIDLLAYQHIKGSIPSDIEKLARIVRLTKEEFEPLWENVKNNFVLDNQMVNRMVNRKLTDVITERKTYAKKLKITGIFASIIKHHKNKKEIPFLKKSFDTESFMKFDTDEIKKEIEKWYNQTVNQMVIHLDNNLEDEDEIEDEIKNKKERESQIKNILAPLNLIDLTDDEKSLRMNVIYNELKSSEVWITDIQRLTHKSRDDTWTLIKAFLDTIKAAEDFYKPLNQIKKHCTNWIRKYNPPQ